MRYSVIIPCFNVAKYISNALISLSSDARDNVEVIIIDDGSTDELFDEVKRFINTSNIIFIQQENMGVSSARNRGLDLASGEYIYFFDGDDEVSSDFFDTLDSVLDNHSRVYDIVSFGYSYIIDSKPVGYYGLANSLQYKTSGDIDCLQFLSSILRRESYQCMCSFIVRRDFLDGLRFNHELHYYEDFDFQVKLLSSAENLYFINKPLFLYNKRNSSAVNRFVTEYNFDVFKALEYMSVALKGLNLERDIDFFRCYTYYWLVRLAFKNGIESNDILSFYESNHCRYMKLGFLDFNKKTLFVFACSLLPKKILLAFIKRFSLR